MFHSRAAEGPTTTAEPSCRLRAATMAASETGGPVRENRPRRIREMSFRLRRSWETPARRASALVNTFQGSTAGSGSGGRDITPGWDYSRSDAAGHPQSALWRRGAVTARGSDRDAESSTCECCATLRSRRVSAEGPARFAQPLVPLRQLRRVIPAWPSALALAFCPAPPGLPPSPWPSAPPRPGLPPASRSPAPPRPGPSSCRVGNPSEQALRAAYSAYFDGVLERERSRVAAGVSRA